MSVELKTPRRGRGFQEVRVKSAGPNIAEDLMKIKAEWLRQ